MGRAGRAGRTRARAGRDRQRPAIRGAPSGSRPLAFCARHTVGSSRDEGHVHEISRLTVSLQMYRLKPRRAADHLTCQFSFALYQDLSVATDLGSVEGELVFVDL